MNPVESYKKELTYILKKSDYKIISEIISSFEDAVSELQLGNSSTDELQLNLGSPEVYIQTYLDVRSDKVWKVTGIADKSRNDLILKTNNSAIEFEKKLRIRSIVGSKFYPKLRFVLFVYLGLMITLLTFTIYRGIHDKNASYIDDFPFIISFYYIYEAITGISGRYFGSRIFARRVRVIVRFTVILGLFTTFLFYNILGYSSGDQTMYDLWIQVFPLLEIIIIVKETVPGFCGIDLPKPYRRFSDLNIVLLTLSILMLIAIPAFGTLSVVKLVLALSILSILLTSKSNYKPALYFYSVILILPLLTVLIYLDSFGTSEFSQFREVIYFAAAAFLIQLILIIIRLGQSRTFYFACLKDYYSKNIVSPIFFSSIINAINDDLPRKLEI